jgi:hypothetical protein
MAITKKTVTRGMGVLKEDFERFEEHLLTVHGLEKGTVNQYRCAVEELASLSKEPKEITEEELRTLEADMAKRLSQTTVRSKRKKIDAFLGFCLVGPIPQVVAILPVDQDQSIWLKQAARDYLGVGDRKAPLYVRLVRDEVILSSSGEGVEIAIDDRKRIRLLRDFFEMLGLGEGPMVALIERERGLAVKRFELVQEEGDEVAGLVDVETPRRLIRKAITNPMPEEALPKLRERYRDLQFRHDVGAFLAGRRTLEAWKARRILGTAESGDEKLMAGLREERLRRQLPDGSWEQYATITARNLRELSDLGMTMEDPEIRRGAQWLLDRPESEYNPGMFFATDDLVKEQAEVIKRRRKHTKGPKERFNDRKALEVGLVRAADNLMVWPCGPRISWTTAIVLEALLRLGLEDEERVRSALWMLKACRWCDNSQQHGISPDKQNPAMVDEPAVIKTMLAPSWLGIDMKSSVKSVAEFDEESVKAYRNGVQGREKILMNDRTSVRFHLRRQTHLSTDSGEVYGLSMPGLGAGCMVVMVRALSQVKDRLLRGLVEAHLWHLVSSQDRHGAFRGRRYFTDPTIFMLDLLSRYDHPVATLGILRAVPWMLRNQKEDGSWGEEPYKDSATLIVLEALGKVSEYLPPGFVSVDPSPR